jgi:hypothetical protein
MEQDYGPDAILNLDDGVLIDKKGLLCLFHAWCVNPSRLVGTFLRQTIGTKYIWKVAAPIQYCSASHLDGT